MRSIYWTTLGSAHRFGGISCIIDLAHSPLFFLFVCSFLVGYTYEFYKIFDFSNSHLEKKSGIYILSYSIIDTLISSRNLLGHLEESGWRFFSEFLQKFTQRISCDCLQNFSNNLPWNFLHSFVLQFFPVTSSDISFWKSRNSRRKE